MWNKITSLSPYVYSKLVSKAFIKRHFISESETLEFAAKGWPTESSLERVCFKVPPERVECVR